MQFFLLIDPELEKSDHSSCDRILALRTHTEATVLGLFVTSLYCVCVQMGRGGVISARLEGGVEEGGGDYKDQEGALDTEEE